MEAYTGFAEVYDTFMDDTPYEEWAELLVTLLRRYGPAVGGLTGGENGAASPAGAPEDENAPEAPASALLAERRILVDLGCGTGTLTELLVDAGYDMIGIDSSEEMLSVAMRKKERSGKDILYLLQDMREMELYGTVGAVVSVCDSLNYLLEEEDLLTVFRLVNNYLCPGGVFIFDFNTVYKYGTVIGDATIAENREDCSFIWENGYDPESGINEYDLTLFVRADKDGAGGSQKENKSRELSGTDREREAADGETQDQDGLFYRFTETHFQRGYTYEQMAGLVRQAGMELLEAFDGDTRGPVEPESERIYIVAREAGKEPANE